MAAAAAAIVLLLWHELASLAGRPFWAAVMLAAAACWGYGTHRMRRTTIPAPTLTLAFWMTVGTTVVMTALAPLERQAWHAPSPAVWMAIAYNAVLVFGFAQPAWLILARGLPPVASSLSVMMIPVIGLAAGATWLGETLHWQDFAAIALLLLSIASVLLPARRAAAVRA